MNRLAHNLAIAGCLALVLGTSGLMVGCSSDSSGDAESASSADPPIDDGSGEGSASMEGSEPSIPSPSELLQPPPQEPEPTERSYIEDLMLDSVRESGIDLRPRWASGDRFRRTLTYTSAASLSVTTDHREARTGGIRTFEIDHTLEIVRANRWSIQEFTITFHSIAVDAQGNNPEGHVVLPDLPSAGHVWSCERSADETLCDVGDGEVTPLPAWFPVDYMAVMPGHSIKPGDSWTRRSDTPMLFGLRPEDTSSVNLTAEQPYATPTGNQMDLAFVVGAERTVEAFGRQLPIELEGSGSLLFDMSANHVAGFNYTLYGSTQGEDVHADMPYIYERSMRTSLRMTSARIR